MFLPEDCVSTILSLTSPQDACRSSLVSSTFNSAAESDVVWEKFLPSDYQELLLRLVNDNPLKHPTKKELFFHLCNPVLIDGGRKSFKIERASGKKSYLLSARELSITWSDEPMYWSWKHMTDSRFAEVVELITISWLEIHGKIRTQSLSKNTAYSAYLVLNISNRAYGLDMAPFETSVKVGNQVSYGTACVCRHDEKKQQNVDSDQTMKAKVFPGNEPIPSERNCGWTEIKLGEFFTGEEDEEVNINLMETKGIHLKAGLVIEGIEVRPKD
ncbi:F-box protein [Morus notabilis]|uniref:F-box protein n=1 Tax=Morus notabilis TaxID=981085 RepID=W9RMP6_9ROSA|nr:F-box protein PP2-B15 [Morus notabilis]EXB60973.1 F-box protein [Morus notabilis]